MIVILYISIRAQKAIPYLFDNNYEIYYLRYFFVQQDLSLLFLHSTFVVCETS